MEENYPTVLSVERVHRAMHAVFEASLSPLGLNGAQWDTLRLIGREPGITGAEIARRTQTTPPATTKMLQRLEANRYVTRTVPSKGRAVETHLTPEGKALLAEGDRVAAKLEAHLRNSFDSKQHESFLLLLAQCYETFKQ